MIVRPPSARPGRVFPWNFPIELHPEFRGWFRDHYEKACVMLPDDLKENQARYQGNDWRQVFNEAGTRGPDVKE